MSDLAQVFAEFAQDIRESVERVKESRAKYPSLHRVDGDYRREAVTDAFHMLRGRLSVDHPEIARLLDEAWSSWNQGGVKHER